MGLNTKFICTTPEQIIDAYHSAQVLLEQLKNQDIIANQMELVMDSVDIGIAILDSSSRITRVNLGFERLSHLPSTILIGRSPSEFFPNYQVGSSDQTQFFQLQNQLVSVKERVISSEYGETFRALILQTPASESGFPEETCRANASAGQGMSFDQFLTRENEVRELVKKAKQYASSPLPILICGASGSGKSTLAQCIHNYARPNTTFKSVDCSIMSEDQLDSVLFGNCQLDKPGVFESARGGTVYMSSIDSLSPALQAKLLRMLKNNSIIRTGGTDSTPVNVHLILSSTNNLKSAASQNTFRSDLYYRINILNLFLPQLKSRKKDILFLFRSFVASISGLKSEDIKIDDSLANLLLNYSWPGNLTQLYGVAFRYILSGQDSSGNYEALEIEDCLDAPLVVKEDFSLDLKQLSKVVEGIVIDSLLRQGMSKTDVARVLGISRAALYNKIESR